MKHLLAILVFFLAVVLQLWFAPNGVRGDFALTMLVVFAFLFDFWELAAFILLAVFLLNPSPMFNVAILFFVLIPFAVHFLRKRFSWDPWLGGACGIAGAVFLFYVVTVPQAAFHAVGFLLVDILVCVLFGELVLCGMTG